jgi:serine protease AprX
VTNLPFDIFLCNVQNPTYYTCASGTSMAAPHVAGTVALMYQAAGGRLKPSDVKDALVRTARPMSCDAAGTPCQIWQAGAGYLDAYAAVLAVQTQPALAVAAR